MIRNPSLAAGCFACLFGAFAAAPRAAAGPVLLTRESDIRATGASAAGDYDLSNGSGDFAPFADDLASDAAAPARSSARQQSHPQVDAGGILAGATADGSARAAVASGVGDAFSSAETDFDLVFRVDHAPTLFAFDATLAAGGDASTGVNLNPKDNDGAAPVFSLDVASETRTVRQTALLQPGTYGLSVWAFARGTPAESAASYSISVTLREGDPGVMPVPLPAAVWAGLAGLSVVAMVTFRLRKSSPTGQD